MSKEKENCCSTSNCCGFEKSSIAKLLNHIADFFESGDKESKTKKD